MSDRLHVLTLSCPDQPGIVARVTGLLFDHGGNIREAAQFDDAETGRFFMRVVFTLPDAEAPGLSDRFADLVAQRQIMRTVVVRPGRAHRIKRGSGHRGAAISSADRTGTAA